MKRSLTLRLITLTLALLFLFLIACTDSDDSDDYYIFVPYNPTPFDGNGAAPRLPLLSWQCSHPEEYPLYYEVYMGLEEDGILHNLAEDLPHAYYQMTDTLEAGTAYIWRVIAWDSLGNTSMNQLWHFTTADTPI